MKKILIILVFLLVSSLTINAQNNVNPSQSTVNNVSELIQLENDYNYMMCDFALFKLQSGLNNLSQDLNIKINSIKHDIYNGIYNKELYNAYIMNYNSSQYLFNSLKEEYEAIKEFVTFKKITSNFTNNQNKVLNSYFNTINKAINNVEASFEFYDLVVQMYNIKR